MSIKQFILSFLFIALISNLHGQITKPVILNPVTITANKVSEKISETGKNVTIIPDSVLQNFIGRPITEVISLYTGIFVVGARSNLGTNQDVYLRGAKRGYTLILIDGIPTYDNSDISNVFDLNFIVTNRVERIEILKDGQSTLYGSDAVAGVINIITKKNSQDKPWGYNVSLLGGSFQTFQGHLKMFGSVKNTDYDINISTVQSKGFSTAKDSTGKQNYEKDGFKSDNLGLNLKHKINDNFTLRLNGNYTKYKTDLDGNVFVDDKDFTFKGFNSSITTGLDFLKMDNLEFHSNYRFSVSERLYTDDSLSIPVTAFDKYSQSIYNSYNNFGEIYAVYTMPKFIRILVGTDVRADKMAQNYLSISSFGQYETTLAKDSTAANLFSTYFSLSTIGIKYFGSSFSGRYNKHSIYGNNFTYSFNPYVSYKKLKLFFNLSTAFKTPSLYQLYSPYANKKLLPEESTSTELGLNFTPQSNFDGKICYFQRNIQNIIIFQSSNSFPYGKYANFDRQKDKGIEVEINYKATSNLAFNLNYAYVNGLVSTQVNGRDTSYFNLFRRPKNLFNFNCTFTLFNDLTINPTIKYIGKRVDNFYDNNLLANRLVNLESYTLIDMNLNYKINSKFKFFMNLCNIGNKDFSDIYGYNTKKFNFNFGFNFSN